MLLPPYHLIGDSVWNAHRVTRAEADALQSAHELTFLPDPIPARVGYQMFVDLQFRTDYLPQDSVESTLTEIATRHLELAQAALRSRNLEDAERFAGIAFCADHRKVSPLVIKAAVRRLQQNRAGEQLMASIASRWITGPDFTALVDSHCQEACGAPPPSPKRPSLAGIAACRNDYARAA